MVLRSLTRHLLDVRRLGQLLGDDADEHAHDSLALLDRKGPPELMGSEWADQPARARGGTKVVRR
jgi:hypothetical protein